MKRACAPISASRALLASLTAALLAGCATQAAPSEQADEMPTQQAVVDQLRAQVVSVETLSPDDLGIAALARAVSGASLVSFAGSRSGTREDAALKGALTEALLQSANLGLLILDVPCEGGAILDDYVSGTATSKLAAELVREAPIHEGQKSATLADTLTMLRGWNAVNINQPVRVAGMHCPVASEVTADRLAIFWGLDQLPAHTGEKDMAAAARLYGEPALNHVWLVQTDTNALSDLFPGSGWLDVRALPESPDVAAWRLERAASEPLLRPQHPSSADIIFRHVETKPAEPF